MNKSNKRNYFLFQNATHTQLVGGEDHVYSVPLPAFPFMCVTVLCLHLVSYKRGKDTGKENDWL